MAPIDGFCGIDPDEMGQMAASMRGAADKLTAFTHEFGLKLRRHEISTPALAGINGIAEWGREQATMLDGRAELIQSLNSTGDSAPQPLGGQGLIHLPDELAGYESARALATMYGQDIFVNFSGELQGKLIHEHTDEIEALAKNPQAAAAFFALLSPKVRDALPDLIAATGSKTAKQDLAAFSKALGAALRAPTLLPAFAKIRSELVKPTESIVVAWNRLALLKGANAPSDVRSAAARALILDDFVKEPRNDWRAGTSPELGVYGLSPDLVALGLDVLGSDGTAVRDAFSKMGGGEVKLTQPQKMKLFLDYAKAMGTGDDVATAFGRAVEAGAEVATEKPGQHSSGAAAFTLDVMMAAGTFGYDIPDLARPSMVAIAKSYIHELATGARFDKAVYRDSGLTPPERWIVIPGITPSFYLSPGDTYRFLATFSGDKDLTHDFDAVAGQFRHDTLVAAARLDAQGDTRHFEDAARAFGDLGGVEFKAVLDMRGERDATDDLVLDITKNTLALGVDAIPVAGTAAKVGWELTKAYGASALLDGWADSFETRVEEATGARSDFAIRQKYDMAHILHEASFPASDPPGELISKSTGDLKTYDELLAEAKREATPDKTWEKVLRDKLVPYERWMDSNDDFDTKVEPSSTYQANDTAKDLLRIWD
ncbi:hypothetical protein HNP84_000600 [Thermocatellispora tengchongensis]|uniref:Uncharacterized protein n=1 Tax=Thermocatellispora tengchongensis TaxID=1073253 RepID=A0A840NUI4_9ACTN|nr:hypothetical protein [Thermocatellispora tengchongensis]MBB5130912.1 hypothetical protein [Thermocatellispora tengchongensis]